jgi:hypothetical protein
MLVIGSKAKSLVDYKIVHAATNREYSPENLFSDAMQWAAFWQDDDTLWVRSSDIGLSVWKWDPQGGFSQEWLGPSSMLVPSVPAEIWDILPSSIKRQWEPLRKQRSEQAVPSDGHKPSSRIPSDGSTAPADAH